MIKTKLKTCKGITIITLIFAIVIMLIISSILIFNAQTGVHTRALNNMYNDVKNLKNKVDLYYSKFGALPIINTRYTNINHLKEININDNNNYYVIDLELLENLTLSYGQEYNQFKNNKNQELTDIYIINEETHTVYYVRGISLDNKKYYTTVGDYTKIQLPNLNNVNNIQITE